MKCNRNGKVLTFTFADGLDPIVFDADKATTAPIDAMMHGYEQKLRDSAAIARKQKDANGKEIVVNITEQMRRDNVAAMFEHLTTKTDWNTKVARVAPPDPFITAQAARRGITYAAMQELIANMEMDTMDNA